MAIDKKYVVRLLSGLGLLEWRNDDWKLGDGGKQVLAVMLTDLLPERHGPAFEPIKKAAGSVVAVEALIIDEGKILLAWRVHPVFGKGWHTPGTYPKSAEGESFEEAVRRAARDETGLEIKLVRKLDIKDHNDYPRFPDAPILYLCRVVGGEIKNLTEEGDPNPNDCRWFEACPPDMLPIQEDYREDINRMIQLEKERDEVGENLERYYKDHIGR